MRIAFVDLGFAWPPPGGAQADLYHTMLGLQAMGYEVRLFGACYEYAWRFGFFDPATLPFPSTPLWFLEKDFKLRRIQERFRLAVDAWNPDIVFMGSGGWIKPHLIEALSQHPIISRYYMYEHLCIRDMGLFKRRVCPLDVLSTPDACFQCAFQNWAREIRSGCHSLWGLEYARAHAYLPAYTDLCISAMRKVRVAIVNNSLAKERLEGHCPDIQIVPGGVDITDFDFRPLPDRGAGDKKIILMVGRADDQRKGAQVLIHAGEGLWETRKDFEVWVTADPDDTDFELGYTDFEWLKYVGWHDHSRIKSLYQQADICVVPSIWEEPFGLVAVEAMATGRPVCASRVGGLTDIVVHGETGVLFRGGNAVDLAFSLIPMLDDPDMRRRMGEAGRRRAEEDYDWRVIIARYLPHILERALR